MFYQFTCWLALLGLLATCTGYNITPFIDNGFPKDMDIPTDPFKKIGENYYYFELRSMKNWFNAYESCRLIGTELIAFDTIEEWNAINTYLKDNKIDYLYWTAGTNLANESKHVWFSNAQSIKSELWFPGEPNNQGGNERCVELGFSSGGATFTGLNDKDCSNIRPYICKAPQPKTISFVVSWLNN